MSQQAGLSTTRSWFYRLFPGLNLVSMGSPGNPVMTQVGFYHPNADVSQNSWGTATPVVLAAVSYTHLDVYKRQRPTWAKEEDAGMNNTRFLGKEGGVFFSE